MTHRVAKQSRNLCHGLKLIFLPRLYASSKMTCQYDFNELCHEELVNFEDVRIVPEGHIEVNQKL